MKKEQSEDKHILTFLRKYPNTVEETLFLSLEYNSHPHLRIIMHS